MGVLVMTDNGQPDVLPDVDPEIADELQEEWMRATYAAKYLGVDPTIIYRRIRQGRLESIKLQSKDVKWFAIKLVKRDQILNWDSTHLPRSGRPRKNRS